MKVKICGIQNIETAKAACEYGVDALGFVFARSKRQVTPEKARDISRMLPNSVLKIGVFVNESIAAVEEIAAFCNLDYVQLHGDEDEVYLQKLHIPAIQAFGVSSEQEVEQAFASRAPYILLDSPKGKYRGGNGTSFPWELLRSLSPKQRQRLIIAGGLSEENVLEAIRITAPFMVDASSSLETNGKKDIEKIRKFIKKVKEC